MFYSSKFNAILCVVALFGQRYNVFNELRYRDIRKCHKIGKIKRENDDGATLLVILMSNS